MKAAQLSAGPDLDAPEPRSDLQRQCFHAVTVTFVLVRVLLGLLE